MHNIVPSIPTLDQYLTIQKEEPERFRPDKCPYCGKAGLWSHGHYDRKADRIDGSHNPVIIPRFFCPSCHKTCSVFPECISPRRWYLWSLQQVALVLVLAGKSLTATAKKVTPSRHTISRWLGRLKERFRLHKDALTRHFIDLGRSSDFTGFWLACFKKISLSRAMCFCNAAGVDIP